MNIEEYLRLDENEKPLDRLCFDGGMCAIFRTIGCIGDSLSSGEFETVDDDGKLHYHDFYEYSWGQYISRSTGSKVYNMSKGGMTAYKYRTYFADEMGFWNEDYKFQAYIIALGVNDSSFYQPENIGSYEDVDNENFENNAHSFYGDYSYIIQRLQKMQPDAKIFLITMPKRETRLPKKEALNNIIRDIAARFNNTYVIDLEKYGPVYDKEFRDRFNLRSHLNPMGYYLSARMIESYIDYIVRHNYEDFTEVALIGTPFNKGILEDKRY